MATPAPRPSLLTVGRYAGVANCQAITVSGHLEVAQIATICCGCAMSPPPGNGLPHAADEP
jgi:hypothetical protein